MVGLICPMMIVICRLYLDSTFMDCQPQNQVLFSCEGGLETLQVTRRAPYIFLVLLYYLDLATTCIVSDLPRLLDPSTSILLR